MHIGMRLNTWVFSQFPSAVKLHTAQQASFYFFNKIQIRTAIILNINDEIESAHTFCVRTFIYKHLQIS